MKRLFWRIWPLTRLADVLDERDALRAGNEIRLRSMKWDERDGLVLQFSHHVMPLLAEALAVVFKEKNATNYVECQVDKAPITSEMQLGEFTLTLQRTTNPTPHQKRRAVEHELELLSMAVAGWQEAQTEPTVRAAIERANAYLDANYRNQPEVTQFRRATAEEPR